MGSLTAENVRNEVHIHPSWKAEYRVYVQLGGGSFGLCLHSTQKYL